MGLRLFGLLLLAAFPSSALAAPVLVLGPGRHVARRNDPFLSAVPFTPLPASATAHPARLPARAHLTRRRPAPAPTVVSELARLYHSGAISQAQWRSYAASFNAALASARRLTGTRGAELEAVIENLHAIAAAGELTPTRLPALFLTLDRNRQWWTTGPLLSADERVEFAGSQIVWEYYPGQGIELQVLGTFGKADGMYTAGPSAYQQLRALMAEMIPLAADRGGGIAWEYYFRFDGGLPPWTSAMSQGTALDALTRASQAFADPSYLAIGADALAIFRDAPPTGVAVAAPLGTRFLQYSFAPQTDIINAFLQTLIGLYDYGHASGNAEALALFAAGDAEARAEVPRFDTGAWSLYQPGQEDTLSYHLLVTGFLQQLCQRTDAPVYCVTAQNFTAYLTTPPALTLLTVGARRARPLTIRFRLSKYSHVGIVVERGTQIVFETSAPFAYGVEQFAVPPLKQTGLYAIRLAATDLAGNFARIQGTLTVTR